MYRVVELLIARWRWWVIPLLVLLLATVALLWLSPSQGYQPFNYGISR